jgi:deoxyribodipyrimidine photo-lyase
VGIEDAFVHEPWKAPNARSILGKVYPEPIVDHLAAAKRAKDKIWGIRAQVGFGIAAKVINNKHGSRKSGIPMRGMQKDENCLTDQLSFKFDNNNVR